jgi:hypothetical protein
MNWVFQPHTELYNMLAANHKSDNVDKTYIPTYFYLGGAGTGKSRHASEFASSVQNAIPLCNKHPLYPELEQRFKAPLYVFNISFDNGTPLTVEERSDPWNAIGVRMLDQLLDEPIEYIRSRCVADPEQMGSPVFSVLHPMAVC